MEELNNDLPVTPQPKKTSFWRYALLVICSVVAGEIAFNIILTVLLLVGLNFFDMQYDPTGKVVLWIIRLIFYVLTFFILRKYMIKK